MKKQQGFTLVELMIVVAIIGILASVGYPAYISSVQTGNRADGISALLLLSGRMEEFYMNDDTYENATVASATSSDGLYTMAITAADDYIYTLTAAPIKGDDKCGTLVLNSLGEKMVDTGSGAAADANCW